MTLWGIDSAEKKKRNPISIRRAGRRGFCPNGAGVRKAYCDVSFFLRVVFVRSTQARHLKVRDHRGIFSCMERDSAMIQSRRRRRPEMSVLRLRSRAPFPSLPRQAHRRGPPPRILTAHNKGKQRVSAQILQPRLSIHPETTKERSRRSRSRKSGNRAREIGSVVDGGEPVPLDP